MTRQSRQPTAAREPARHEDADGNVVYRRGGNQGVALVRALLDHDGADTDPARVAEVMAQHPGDADEIAAFVHDHAGNHFLSRVTRALRTARRAEAHNLVIADFVDADDGYDRAKDTGKGKSRLDRNRLADHNHLPELGAAPAPVYSNTGGELGRCAPGQRVEINAGAVSKIPIDGKAVRCLFVYKADAVGGDGTQLFGWVPIHAFVQNGVLLHIVAKDKAIAHELEDAQRDGVEFSGQAEVVQPHKLPPEIGDLRTIRTQAEKENFARHYGARPDGTVNLLVDVPGTGRGRIGAASDRVGAGSKFFRATNLPATHAPLYHTQTADEHDRGVARQSGHVLTFVYGYTENAVGSRQYGWLLQEHLTA